MTKVRFYRDESELFEIKKSDAIDDLSYKKHSHEEYSFGIVNRGTSSFWCEGIQNEIGQKSLVFIPQNVVHACNPQQSLDWSYRMVYVQADWLKELATSRACEDLNQLIVRKMETTTELREANRLIESLTEPVSRLEKEAVLVTLYETVFGNGDMKKAVYRKPKAKVSVIKEYLDTFFREKISLAQLEQISGLNKFYIIRAFKEEFSIPPHTYQTLLRINHAKRELKKDRTITEVAYEAGFYDQSHFNKVFKNQVGVTPERYQNAI